jgi:chloramphenicol-sensitive protein RarD
MQFLLGVLVFHEQMSTGRWAGFALVWLALVIITTESFVNGRRVARAARRRPVPPPVENLC